MAEGRRLKHQPHSCLKRSLSAQLTVSSHAPTKSSPLSRLLVYANAMLASLNARSHMKELLSSSAETRHGISTSERIEFPQRAPPQGFTNFNRNEVITISQAVRVDRDKDAFAMKRVSGSGGEEDFGV